MLLFTIISLALLIAFTAWASGIRGTIPESYSQLGTDVGEYCPGAPVNPWSAVTFVVAFLMVPPMIEAGNPGEHSINRSVDEGRQGDMERPALHLQAEQLHLESRPISSRVGTPAVAAMQALTVISLLMLIA